MSSHFVLIVGCSALFHLNLQQYQTFILHFQAKTFKQRFCLEFVAACFPSGNTGEQLKNMPKVTWQVQNRHTNRHTRKESVRARVHVQGAPGQNLCLTMILRPFWVASFTRGWPSQDHTHSRRIPNHRGSHTLLRETRT